MKYRTKLYISLVLVSLISIVIALVIFSTKAEQLIYSMFRSRSLSIAATAAAQLDSKLIEAAHQARSTENPAYQELRKVLRKVLTANRRNDVYASDLYTLYFNPKNPQEVFWGVDTNVSPIVPGTRYNESDASLIAENKDIYFITPYFVRDQYGSWLSGFAPMRNSQGEVLGVLGVDINVSDIHIRLQKLIQFAVLGLSASFFFALVIAFFLSRKVTESLDHLCNIVREIEKGNFEAEAQLETKDEFGQLGDRINAMSRELMQKERLKTSFARYVSTHIMEKVLASNSSLKLEGERRKVTLLFSDLRDFTQLAEQLAPEEVVQILNEYFEQMIEVIFSYSGTLDKFIGDGIMAEFGAPIDDKEQELNAIRAAIKMEEELTKLRKKWKTEGRPLLKMGIGIHTGDVIVGNIGSEKRTDYTAIGDSVNVASRLEQATKTLNTSIVISEATYFGAKDHFPFKDLGSIALPGRKEKIRVFTIDTENG